MAGQGVTLVRIFCFEDGYTLSNTPIQRSPGVYDENGLKRIDLILATAAQYGVYVIVVPTNFEPVGGGISWYVDQVMFCPVSPPSMASRPRGYETLATSTHFQLPLLFMLLETS